jgi:hypothetical protein
MFPELGPLPPVFLIHLWQKIESQMRTKNLYKSGRGREFVGEA